MTAVAAQASPRAFVSYSRPGTEHVDWVVESAERPEADGVGVVLGRLNPKPAHDKFAFWVRMVMDATVAKVLAVCDKVYAAQGT